MIYYGLTLSIIIIALYCVIRLWFIKSEDVRWFMRPKRET